MHYPTRTSFENATASSSGNWTRDPGLWWVLKYSIYSSNSNFLMVYYYLYLSFLITKVSKLLITKACNSWPILTSKDTSWICFNAHKTMVPNRGWQWDRNAFSVIFHIQSPFQAVVRAYWSKFAKCLFFFPSTFPTLHSHYRHITPHYYHGYRVYSLE